jgi:serine/threonine protein phosphatase Stp1
LPIIFQIDSKAVRPERKINMRFDTVARTHIGCRRKTNEDAMLVRPDLGLWVVADGMGGHDAGDFASALVVAKLGQHPCEESLAARAQSARAAITDANQELWSFAASGTPRTIGSTVVALVLDEARFSCLWAGDSRAYLARDGALRRLTRDHSLVQQLVDAGELDPRAAAEHPNANIITRAVGAAPRLELDNVDGDARPGDAFLLASDGFTRLIGEHEILESLQAGDLEAVADELVKTCLERQAPDNLTFVILRLATG